MTDAVGQLLRWSDGTLSVARRDGTVTEITETALVAGKKVPPAPERPAGTAARIRDLQRIAALGWPALHTARLGGWLLRASAGWTLRANSVLTSAPPGTAMDQALDFVTDWYADRGLPVVFSIPDLLEPELWPALDARGWPPTSRRILVMVAAMAALPPGTSVAPVRLAAAPDDGWLGCYRSLGETPAAAVRVLTGNQTAVFAAIRVDEAVAAIARGTLDEGWLGLSAVETAPEARRRGLAKQVVRALVEHGRAAGARQVYLQVADDNEPAIALYRGLGFAEHHAYRYRSAAAPAAAAPNHSPASGRTWPTGRHLPDAIPRDGAEGTR
ncbi:MAG TPA: GNAT family N-acetyltransferase [Sporichthyaceae bacterium]|jgi:ribosomal protein S18 acetylase RimI-like enzyme|nr:GNAT family N-acetyltransferase [Sporichthyaceae bacterium]